MQAVWGETWTVRARAQATALLGRSSAEVSDEWLGEVWRAPTLRRVRERAPIEAYLVHPGQRRRALVALVNRTHGQGGYVSSVALCTQTSEGW